MHPSPSDLHINAPLTNVSIAYIQSADSFLADKVFPKVVVKHQSDLYRRYSKSQWRRTDVKKRAPATETPGVGWTYDTDQYFTHVYGVHKDLDDQTRANADSVFNLDKEATEFITHQHMLKRDIDWTAKYMKPGVWATEYAGVTGAPANGTEFQQWDQAGSDPIGDVSLWLISFRRIAGFAPNVCVMGPYVMVALKQHADIIERIKYTQRGVVTEDLIATLFDIDELYVSYATVAAGPVTGDAVTQDALATYDFIGPATAVLFAYAPKNASTMTPSAGYTFTWSGYQGGNAEGIRIKRFRMEPIASDRIEAEQTYDMKVVSPDMGLYINDAVAPRA
ncbi:MAG: major capsid protein [Mycobacteriales bacterium]